MLYALTVFFGMLLAGFGLFYLALQLAEKIMGRRIPVNVIFKDMKKKMWMTVGLGAVFFGSYLLIVCIAGSLIRSETRLDLFFLLHKHTISFIYLGLLTFAVISISIYMVRLWIKYLYNKKKNKREKR